ncbi:hypothetical protein H0H93_006410 [Arthromyces matolae]|nr:hypothetical protein H0H93_006410 [Arthromyces matolae]
MAELEGIMAAASLEGTWKVQESRDQSVDTASLSPPTSPESPGSNDGHKQKARKQQRFRERRGATALKLSLQFIEKKKFYFVSDPRFTTDHPTSTTAKTGTPRTKPKTLPGSEQFQDDPLIFSMIDPPSDDLFQKVYTEVATSENCKKLDLVMDDRFNADFILVLIHRERNRPLELMKRTIDLETRRRMGLKYSDPVIREDKIFAWPMIEYKERRLHQEARPMLFFDISRKPTDLAYKPFYLAFEGGEELPAEVLEEYLQLPLSPNFPLQMIRIRCEHEVLINWDVIVERKDDQLRVIDVFEAIYNTYNTPLNSEEKRRHRDLVDSRIVDAAFIRRSKYIRADFGRTILRGICRVDLLGNTTLFNGLFFDDTFKQYCLTLREQDPNDIRLSPLF